MWLKRKIRNRRLGREFVLDVKLRSSQVRAARARLAAKVLGSVFAVLFGAYLFWRGGAWALDKLVYKNDAFAIQQIEIHTDGVIALDQLRLWAGVKQGDNLLKLDLARVKRDLEMVPAIQSVSVERILPRSLCIRVIEREPIAQIELPPRASGGLDHAIYQLDAAGYVMVPLDPRERAIPSNQLDEALPAISGVNSRDLQPGRRLDAPAVQSALQLIVAFEASPMAGLVELKRVDVDVPQVLVLTTGQGSQITFSPSDVEQQLRRWQVIFGYVHKSGKAIATLDLAVTNNIPVRWLEASALPPENVRLPQPSRTRRKHV